MRYLGLKRLKEVILKRPQLIMLQIVTDLVIGPTEGYEKCYQSRCCCGLNCCWIFCCNHCKFKEGSDISIHNKLSWFKMAYTQLCSIPAVAIYAIVVKCVFEQKILPHFWLFYASFSILGLTPIGLITFAIILHMENSNKVDIIE